MAVAVPSQTVPVMPCGFAKSFASFPLHDQETRQVEQQQARNDFYLYIVLSKISMSCVVGLLHKLFGFCLADSDKSRLHATC